MASLSSVAIAMWAIPFVVDVHIMDGALATPSPEDHPDEKECQESHR
jgi:hypothetical protein